MDKKNWRNKIYYILHFKKKNNNNLIGTFSFKLRLRSKKKTYIHDLKYILLYYYIHDLKYVLLTVFYYILLYYYIYDLKLLAQRWANKGANFSFSQ